MGQVENPDAFLNRLYVEIADSTCRRLGLAEQAYENVHGHIMARRRPNGEYDIWDIETELLAVQQDMVEGIGSDIADYRKKQPERSGIRQLYITACGEPFDTGYEFQIHCLKEQAEERDILGLRPDTLRTLALGLLSGRRLTVERDIMYLLRRAGAENLGNYWIEATAKIHKPSDRYYKEIVRNHLEIMASRLSGIVSDDLEIEGGLKAWPLWERLKLFFGERLPKVMGRALTNANVPFDNDAQFYGALVSEYLKSGASG